MALKGSRVGKVYHPEKEIVVLSLYKTNVGKVLLKIINGKALFVDEEKEDHPDLLQFGIILRKHLEGYFLDEVIQIEPERIVKLGFRINEEKKSLYLEFFGKGNMILCGEDGVIINSLGHYEFRDRSIKPKISYKHPIMKFNFFCIDKKNLNELLKKSKRENLVTCLATELGLGGVYSEEVCLLSGIDKKSLPANIDGKEAESILTAIDGLINKKIEPMVLYDGGKIADFAPFGLKLNEKLSAKKFHSLSEALKFFYSQSGEAKETDFDRKFNELKRIIDVQKLSIEEMKIEEAELRERGEIIYKNYAVVHSILGELLKASKIYGWKELRGKIKTYDHLKEIDDKERTAIVEF